MGIFQVIKRRLKEDTCSNLFWILNFLPTIAGFPFKSHKFCVKFWVLHIIFLFYIYIVGTVVYQIYDADGFIDSVNSFANISIFVIIGNDSWWFLYKRDDLNELFEYVQKNNDFVTESGRFLVKLTKFLHKMKIIVLICYAFHFIDGGLIYIPFRITQLEDFSIATCVGLQPLTVSPNREICMLTIAVQQFTSITVVSCYDAILLFMFSHVTAVFHLLYEDLNDFKILTDDYAIKSDLEVAVAERLHTLLVRHSYALKTVRKMQDIYSTSIGLSFGINAISMCMFFVLPLDVSLSFAPIIFHCFLVYFIYCYQGQRLTTSSERFEQSVYCCGWEKLQLKHQKSVLLMLMQAQRPVIIYAAGVVPLRLYTFATTMQSIYKFVAVFKLQT